MRLKDVKVRSGTPAELLVLAMAEEKLLRADPRDYALLHGSSLITAFGEYWVTSRLDGRDVDPTNVDGDGEISPGTGRTVLHRRDLWRVLGPAEAKKFWRYGRRTRK